MRPRFMAILGLALSLLMAGGCARTLTVDVTATASPASALDSQRRFALVHAPDAPVRATMVRRQLQALLSRYVSHNRYLPVEQPHPLTASEDDPTLLRHVGQMTRQTLIRRGYRAESRDPQFLVSVDYAFGPHVYFVPPKPASQSVGQPTASPQHASHRTVPTHGRLLTPDDPHPPLGGYHGIVFAHAVTVTVYDARDIERPVWRGSAMTLGSHRTFLALAPHLVDELLQDFPDTSAPVQRRTVALASR